MNFMHPIDDIKFDEKSIFYNLEFGIFFINMSMLESHIYVFFNPNFFKLGKLLMYLKNYLTPLLERILLFSFNEWQY